MKKILVLESEKEIAEAIALILEAEFNCKVIRVYRPPEAIAMIEQFHPDLLTTCLSFPDIDGIEFISHIRKRWSKEELPIIIISMFDSHEVLNRKSDLMHLVNGYFTKPFKPDKLINAIERIFCK